MTPALKSTPKTKFNLIDNLSAALLVEDKEIARLEDAIFSYRTQHLNEESFLKSDRQLARIYFYLYTIPLLESAGLLAKGCFDKAIFWSRVHLLLCLYTRYTDYIIDRDSTGYQTPQILKRAFGYLVEAQDLLKNRGRAWSVNQSAIMVQLFEYEHEVSGGYVHDFSSLWRRVSPLCVLGETYLASTIHVTNFKWLYRWFLSWSLLQSDCDDIFEDLLANRTTPVTILVNEHRAGVHSDILASADTINRIKLFLDKQSRNIVSNISSSCPMWLIIINHMNAIYQEK